MRAAGLVAFYLPMHTATRLALPVIDRVRALNPSAHVCAYGLYAPLNAAILREHGVQTILGPEFEQDLTRPGHGAGDQSDERPDLKAGPDGHPIGARRVSSRPTDRTCRR